MIRRLVLAAAAILALLALPGAAGAAGSPPTSGTGGSGSGGSGTSPSGGTTPPPIPGVPSCALPNSSGPNALASAIHVVRNHEVDGFGHRWVPYGISVAGGLQDGNTDASWRPTIDASMRQIEAAPYWHANVVRIQFSEINMFSNLDPGESVNVPFLNALCQQIQQIRQQGEVAVINDNTEFGGWGQVDPTLRTEWAWQVIYEEFGNQPGWIADLYNEPREAMRKHWLRATAVGRHLVWNVWLNGGEVKNEDYVGMQELVDFTRNVGFNGVEWVEGPIALSLSEGLRYLVQDPAHNFVWAYHHPGLPLRAAWGKTQQWTQHYGYLTKHYPVVDSEWNQAASPRPECQPSAYYSVPPYFRWLRRQGIGLVVWSLQPGSMVAEPPGQTLRQSDTAPHYDPNDPTELMHPSQMYSDYACTKAKTGQGAGQLVFDYFQKYSNWPAAGAA